MSNAIWKPIPGIDKRYEVSEFGQVRSKHNGFYKILKPFGKNRNKVVVFREDGTRLYTNVSRLCYSAFHGAIPDGMNVETKDGTTLIEANNLRLITREKAIEKFANGVSATSKTVAKIDVHGNVVKTYKAASVCAREENISPYTLRKFMRGETLEVPFAFGRYIYAWNDDMQSVFRAEKFLGLRKGTIWEQMK